MFNGTLPNTTVAGKPLARLTIGVTAPGGKRDEIKFVRNEETQMLDCAPSETELNEHYLEVNGWERSELRGIGIVWSDPLTGGDYSFASALDIQSARDMCGVNNAAQ